ncbi:MCE family protein [Nocardioides humilatus]|uniref:MCE family protein n=1 Tax=Nocardioides humilatus TaxID=2607660 RepID=A0A5B1LFV7_9ACTN|nr:MCE family protein [Nocardioides humilatus]KAA1419316.1 MCE family protein [Nocardioides humilatus]
MKLISRDQPLRIGIAAFVALGIFGVVVLAVSVIPFGAHTYQAELTHTAGLRASEGVQIAGVEVGEVRSVKVVDDHVVVTFTVDNDIELGSQTRAEVKVGTLLGTHYLSLSPKGEGDLPDDTIPLAHTSVPFNLQDVIDEGTNAVDQIDGKLVARSLSVVAETLKAAGPKLAPAFNGIERISRVITQREGQIGDLLEASRNISDQLSSSTGDLVQLMEQSNLVIDELVRRREAIRDLLGDLGSITTTINQIMDDNEAKLRPMLRDLDAVVDVLKSRDKQLKGALHSLAVTARYIANATGDGPFINLYFPEVIPDKVRCGPRAGC